MESNRFVKTWGRDRIMILAILCAPAAASAQVEWTACAENPAMGLGPAGSWDGGGFIAFDVHRDTDGSYLLWYAATPNADICSSTIGFSSSEDPCSFDRAPTSFGFGAAWPSVVIDPVAADGYRYKMWFTAPSTFPCGTVWDSAVWYAKSKDNVAWEAPIWHPWEVPAGQPVLTGDPSTGWEIYPFTGYQAVLFQEGLYRMWYKNGTDNIGKIGLATSEDGSNWDENNWVKYRGNPVLIPEGAESSFVGMPDVLFDMEHDLYEMWYVMKGESSGVLGYALSLDGVLWSKQKPDGFGVTGESLPFNNPEVVRDGDTYHLWYSVGNNYPSPAIHHASSSWTYPKPAFTVAPDDGKSPEVTLDASNSAVPAGATIASYAWDFGDGTKGEGKIVTHTYSPGRYVAALTIADDRGQSASIKRMILMSCPPGEIVSPWTAADIGSPIFPGSARSGEEGCFSICAGGTGFGLKDQFHFVSRTFTGDFDLTAEVTDLDSPVNLAGVGLMVRKSLDADAAFAAILLEIENGKIVTRFRTRPGSQKKGDIVTLPFWLRLEWKKSECKAYVSKDGQDWGEPFARSILNLDGSAFAGIAATGKDTGNESVSFQALQASICISMGGRMLPGDCNADGALNLSDAVWLLGHLFLGTQPELPCDGGTAARPGPGALALVDVNGDGAIDVSDAVATLSFLFLGAKPPALGTDCVPIVGCPSKCE